MIRAIQFIQPFSFAKNAHESLDFLIEQDGCLGGRILPPSDSEPSIRVQVFFQDDGQAGTIGATPDEWLPDGCRRVVIPDSIAVMLGIKS